MRIEQGGTSLPIRSDPRLQPVEKETSFCILGNSKRVDVHTLHPTAVRGLLAQPEFEVKRLITEVIHEETVIVGVEGSLPLTSLRIGRPRKDARLSRLFARRGGRRKSLELRSVDTNQSSGAGAQ